MTSKARCLVLGGKGFVGSHLVDALLAKGHQVRIFDRPGPALLEEASSNHPNLETLEGDFANEDDVAAAVADCDICFHLISTTLPRSSNLDPAFDIQTNLIGSVKLLQQAVLKGVKKVIFLSSGGTVYGPAQHLPIAETHPTNPICSYGITKLAVEKYLCLFHQLHGLDFMILRVSNLYGERQRIIASQGAIAVFLGRALLGERIEVWGDGTVVRDYIHISDTIAAMLAAMNYQDTERILNIGSGQGTSLNQILHELEYILGRRVDRSYSKGRAFDVPASVLAIDRAKSALNWEPRMTLAEGLKRTLTWMEERMTVQKKYG